MPGRSCKGPRLTHVQFCGVQLREIIWPARAHSVSNTVNQAAFHYSGFIFKPMRVRGLSYKLFRHLNCLPSAHSWPQGWDLWCTDGIWVGRYYVLASKSHFECSSCYNTFLRSDRYMNGIFLGWARFGLVFLKFLASKITINVFLLDQILKFTFIVWRLFAKVSDFFFLF